MPKQLSPEREREYEDLSAFIDFYSTNIWRIDPANPIHPTNVGRRIVQECGRSKALGGLRQTVNDVVEEMSELPPEAVAELDRALRAAGILSASEIRRRYSVSYKRILKRGVIRTETEYYLVHGIVADVNSSEMDDERVILERMLAVFERRTGV